MVEQRGAQQGDGGVLAGLDVDRSGQLGPADDAQVLGAGVAHGDELGVQTRADASQHLETEVLLALLDACHGALTGAQRLRKVALRQALMTSRIPNQGADPGRIVISHACNHRSKLRYTRHARAACP